MRQAAEVALDALGSPDAELSVVLMDDAGIARLNQAYLNRSGPTNVIAFPMGGAPSPCGAPRLVGDVVISLQTAEREAKSAGISVERRFMTLLVHGILHLFGFDHETDAREALRMEQKCTDIISRIKKILDKPF